MVLPKRHWKQTASYLCILPRNNTRVNRCRYPWQKDPLLGLKENVIIGKIIPAGTGMARYRNMEPKEVGVASENVYSISDIEAQMVAEDAMKNINK